MVRTVISLDEEDKRWLDARARETHVPMAEVVRQAVHMLREASAWEARATDELLQQTSGIWKQGDGLAYQRRMRGEWKTPR
jgi:Arc/MetJ-type ribon-helix-helix transcriptional regulator